eukprot:m.190185 g.190185  ORF g.190185 m.190185 type:complete len:68 (-) comp32396_c1_seq2:171-374(-)
MLSTSLSDSRKTNAHHTYTNTHTYITPHHTYTRARALSHIKLFTLSVHTKTRVFLFVQHSDDLNYNF